MNVNKLIILGVKTLTRLYDVEKSRDKLKTRLDTSSQALGKEEVSRWK